MSFWKFEHGAMHRGKAHEETEGQAKDRGLEQTLPLQSPEGTNPANTSRNVRQQTSST